MGSTTKIVLRIFQFLFQSVFLYYKGAQLFKFQTFQFQISWIINCFHSYKMNSKAYKKISKTSLDRSSSYVFKYLVIGDNSVGKSRLIQSFLDQENERIQGRIERPIATTGVNFHCRTVRIQDQKHKLYLWDTSGQECFRSITKAYFKGTACIFLLWHHQQTVFY